MRENDSDGRLGVDDGLAEPIPVPVVIPNLILPNQSQYGEARSLVEAKELLSIAKDLLEEVEEA